MGVCFSEENGERNDAISSEESNSGEIVCPRCDACISGDIYNLDRHQKTKKCINIRLSKSKNPSTNFHCEYCQKKFTTKKSCGRHERDYCKLRKNIAQPSERPSRKAKDTANEKIKIDAQSNKNDEDIQKQNDMHDLRDEIRFSTGPQ